MDMETLLMLGIASVGVVMWARGNFWRDRANPIDQQVDAIVGITPEIRRRWDRSSEESHRIYDYEERVSNQSKLLWIRERELENARRALELDALGLELQRDAQSPTVH